jgi:hypothetical protein
MTIDFNSLSNDKKIEIIKSDDFKNKLSETFLEFVKVSQMPITGLVFEERFNKALEKLDYETGFVIGNHDTGSDIGGFSLKGNRIYNKKKRITNITSHRTTKFKSLEDKLAYIKEQSLKNCGYVICLREDIKKTTKYFVYYIDSTIDFMQSDIYVWRKRFRRDGKTHAGYLGYSELFDCYMAIEFQASHQLFIKNVNVDDFEKNPKIQKILEINITGDVN